MGKFKLMFGGIFAAVGLTFAAIGGWSWYQDNAFVSTSERAPGVVVGLVRQSSSDRGPAYRPQVVFTDATGQEHSFTGSVGSSPPAYDRGEQVEVIYDPWTPENAIVDSFTERRLFPLIFGGLGSLFTALGLGVLGWGIMRKRTIARLKQRGLPIDAEFLDCSLDTKIAVNGRNPWRVTCQATHPATGQMQVFKSDPIWVYPANELQGKKVRVLVDPAQPKHYFVDLEEYLDERMLP